MSGICFAYYAYGENMLYLTMLKEQPPARWVIWIKSKNSTPTLLKVLGWFYKCQRLITACQSNAFLLYCFYKETSEIYILKKSIVNKNFLYVVI